MVDEGLLHRMQFGPLRHETLDGEHSAPVDLHRWRQTGGNPPPVNMYGAGAALAVVAALLRSSQAELFAKQIEKRGAHIRNELVMLPGLPLLSGPV